ncbi:MAG: SMP-30/gluconolactonase/LRE family protein, partial [Bryobacterales bacterium]|nr:SMP-30/gluconolactonase/LRE family protein [Bryobacterales bacterium]
MKFLLALAVGLRLAAQTYVISTVAGGAPAPAVATATNLPLGGLGRVGSDRAGNVYFTALNSVYQLSPSGAVTRVAGNGTAGFSGDGGPATSAQLNSPQGVAVDSAGNIYIADMLNDRVRVVANGAISTFAGNGTSGSSGDFGDPTQAQLHLPMGLALDSSGNLYIADSANNVIRQISNGIITTFAGNHIQGFAADNNAATVAALSIPVDLAFDSAGNLYIADTGNGRIRQVNTSGVITTFVGGGSTYTEGGIPTASILGQPRGVAVDSSGNLFVTDTGTNYIYKVAGNKITTFAGNGSVGFSGDGNSATGAQINRPSSVVVDSSGNVVFTDSLNYRIRKITTSGTISTVVGNGITSYSGDGGAAQNALLSAPAGVAVAPGGIVYIADTNNQRIRMIAANGTISTVAGNGTPGFSGDGGAAASAQLSFPSGLAIDNAGNIYFSDTASQRVRKISGGNISTVAGNGNSGYAGDGGLATNAQLNSPIGLALDGAGNLYIADFSNQVVRKVTPGGGISTLAGTGIAGYAGDNGQAAQAQLNGPAGVTVDSSGNVYIADSGNHVIREVTPNGTITTVAGNGFAATSGDGGPATSASLAIPASVVIDQQGNLFIVDASANRVRVVNSGGIINTIAGTGTPGYSGDNGPALNAQFNNAFAMALDTSGNLYIADRANNVIRLLQPVSSTPSAAVVTNGASNLTGPISPGETVTIYGNGIGPSDLAVYQSGSDIPMQTGGTSVSVNGVPAPVLYAWANQIGIQIPYEVTPGKG